MKSSALFILSIDGCCKVSESERIAHSKILTIHAATSKIFESRVSALSKPEVLMTSARIARCSKLIASLTPGPSSTRNARLSPPRRVYQLCLEGCRARMKTEVVKMPAGAVKSCVASKVAALACNGKVWQAWVKRHIVQICV